MTESEEDHEKFGGTKSVEKELQGGYWMLFYVKS